MTGASKSEIRKQVLARRDALPVSERRALSERITRQLLALDAYRDARSVMAYASFGGEFETAGFIADVLACGKTLVLPRIERGDRSLHLHAVADPAHQLAPGIWGIPQPRADLCPTVSASHLTFVRLPGVAFPRRCGRLVNGAGCSDGSIRSLARRPPLIAAAFALQVLPSLPVSETDQRVDLVVTEDAEYRAMITGPGA